MPARDFFSPVEQFVMEVEGHRYCAPVFYYAASSLMLSFLAPAQHVKRLLPSERLKPIPLLPGRVLTVLSVLEYRDTDLGPYNEAAIFFPVTLDKPARLFRGFQSWLDNPYMYVWHMPVTSEEARWAGVRVYGFPKFMADIQFTRQEGEVHGRVGADGREIFSMSAPASADQPGNPLRINLILSQGGRLLRCQLIQHFLKQGGGSRLSRVHFQLGDHPIAEELRQLQISGPVSYQYTPEMQTILTFPLESLALKV